MTRVAVLGAGAWGTAIAAVLASRLEVALWARDAAQAAAIAGTRPTVGPHPAAGGARPRAPPSTPPSTCGDGTPEARR